MVLVGQVILEFPTQKETSQENTVINVLCEERNSCPSPKCLVGKSGDSEKEQKLSTERRASLRARR